MNPPQEASGICKQILKFQRIYFCLKNQVDFKRWRGVFPSNIGDGGLCGGGCVRIIGV